MRVLFQKIQLSMSTQFSSIWSIDMPLSDTTTSGLSRPENDSNKGILRIPQSSSISEASPPDCFVSYPGNSLRYSYPSAELESVYSAVPVDWAKYMVRNVIRHLQIYNILALNNILGIDMP